MGWGARGWGAQSSKVEGGWGLWRIFFHGDFSFGLPS